MHIFKELNSEYSEKVLWECIEKSQFSNAIYFDYYLYILTILQFHNFIVVRFYYNNNNIIIFKYFIFLHINIFDIMCNISQ